MTTDETLATLLDEVTSLRARLDAQDAELAALRGADGAKPDPRFNRRHLIGALAGLGAAGAAGLATAPPAAAANGDALTLGQQNFATAATSATVIFEEPDIAFTLASNGFATIMAGGINDGMPSYGVMAGGTEAGVFGLSEDGSAILGDNNSSTVPTIACRNRGGGPALHGLSDDGPQLWLESQEDEGSGAPTSGDRFIGQIRADPDGDLWLCVASGNPGTWTRLLREDTAAGRVTPIPAFRALDTRAANGRATGAPAVPGQMQGPLSGGQEVTLDLAGVAPIPATASGIIGNLTVISPSGKGYLRAYAAGTTSTTSAVNFPAGENTANAFTSAINPTGLRLVAPISSTITYHLVVDITAYIT